MVETVVNQCSFRDADAFHSGLFSIRRAGSLVDRFDRVTKKSFFF